MLAFLDSLFGLPAHPLVVHAAVVIVPLVAIATIVMAFSPKIRARIGWIVAGLGVLGFVFAFLAKESGESLLETTRLTAAVRTHAEMGSQGVIGAFLVGGSACALMLLDLYVARATSGGRAEPSIVRPLRGLFGVFAVGLCIFGSVLVIDVGHSGAKATWENKDLAPTVHESGE